MTAPPEAPFRIAVDGCSYGAAMSGSARRSRCLLPALARRGWRPVLFLNQTAAPAFADLPGVETVALPVPQLPGPLRQAAVRRCLPGPFQELGCRLLLTETPPAPPGLPFLLTVHDTRAWDAPELLPAGRRWWMRRAIPPALRSAEAVMAVSEWSAQRLAALSPSCRAWRVRNGCDHLPAATAPDAGTAPPLLLAAGPWGRHKGLDTLLEAYARLAAARPGGAPALLLTGRTGRRLPPGVACREVSDEEMAGLLAGAAAAVRPSRFEGFDLPLGEALAAGCPVVASDLPVHREVAGDAAWFYPVGDAAALAAALQDCLDAGPPARGRAVEAGRDRAAELSWDRAAAELDHRLRSYIDSPSQRTP